MRQPVKYSHNSEGVVAPFKRNKPEKHKIIFKKFLFQKKNFLRAAKPEKIHILRQKESSSNNI